MADTAVAITAGTGTNIDTRTEATNGNHRQVVVLGDPATNAGVAPVDATNGLSVDVKASALPSGAATSAKQDTGNTSLATVAGAVLADDADFTATTTTGISAMGVYESTPTTVTDGDLGTVGITSGRRLKTSATIDAALPAGTNAIGKLAANSGVDIGDVTIDNASIAVTQSGTWDEVGINDSGNSITVDNAQLSVVGTGTEAAAMRVTIATDSTGVLSVDDNGGALTVDGTVTANLAAGTNNIGDIDVLSIAAGDNNIGNVDVVTLPALAAGTNTIGAIKSVPSDIDINGSNANHADKYYTNAGAVTDGIVWSPAAGKRWHVLTLYINVSAAATVTLEDDLAGGDVVRWKGEFAANSGITLKYDKEHPFCSTEDAADLIITTTAGNVYVQAVGYEI